MMQMLGGTGNAFVTVSAILCLESVFLLILTETWIYDDVILEQYQTYAILQTPSLVSAIKGIAAETFSSDFFYLWIYCKTAGRPYTCAYILMLLFVELSTSMFHCYL